MRQRGNIALPLRGPCSTTSENPASKSATSRTEKPSDCLSGPMPRVANLLQCLGPASVTTYVNDGCASPLP